MGRRDARKRLKLGRFRRRRTGPGIGGRRVGALGVSGGMDLALRKSPLQSIARLRPAEAERPQQCTTEGPS